MYNKVILIGTLGKDPEIKDINGKKMAKLSLSTWHNKKVGENWEKEFTWHNIVVWGQSVLSIEKCEKGDTLYVEGEFRNNTYQDKNGNNIHSYSVVGIAKQIRPNPKKDYNYQKDGYGASNNSKQSETPKQEPRVSINDNIDANDLPF